MRAQFVVCNKRITGAAACPQCNGSGYRWFDVFAVPRRPPIATDAVRCWSCNGSGRRAA